MQDSSANDDHDTRALEELVSQLKIRKTAKKGGGKADPAKMAQMFPKIQAT
jgi:hypothetical protein